MARLTRWILLLGSIFALLLTMIRVTAAPPDRTFAVFQRDPNCLQPCWHGIQLGTTTIDEAYTILRADRALITVNKRIRNEHIDWQLASLPAVDASLDTVGNLHNIILSVEFDIKSAVPQRFTLENAVQLWGAPVGALSYFCSSGGQEHLVAEVFFAGNIQVTSLDLSDQAAIPSTSIPISPKITPDLPIAVALYYGDAYPWGENHRQPWRGFWRAYRFADSYFNEC